MEILSALYNYSVGLLASVLIRTFQQVFCSEAVRAKQRSLAIDRALHKSAEHRARHYNVILFGERDAIDEVHEAFQSNVARAGRPSMERLSYRHNVEQAAFTYVEIFLKFWDGREHVLSQSEQNRKNLDYLRHQLEHSSSERPILDEQTGLAISALWSDDETRRAFESTCDETTKFRALYFLDNIVRVTTPDYIPTDTDISRSRKNFGGSIVEVRYNFPDLTLNVLSIVNRCEIRKFMHFFNAIPVVVIVFDLCDYDETLSGYSRLESMDHIYQSVVGSDRFTESAVVVLMTGYSQFRRKVRNNGFRVRVSEDENDGFRAPFPDYETELQDEDEVERVEEYLAGRFGRTFRDGPWVKVAFVDQVDEGVADIVKSAISYGFDKRDP